MAVFDEVGRIAHGSGGVVKQRLFLRGIHQVKQRTRLAEIIAVVFAEIPVRGVAVDFQRRLGILRLLLPLAEAVGLVVQGAAVVAVNACGAVAVVAVHGAAGGINRNLVIIHPQAVALRIGIVKQTRLQHFIGRHADAGHQIAGREGGLFHIGIEVFRVFIKLEFAHFNQRVIAFGPHFGEVEGVVRHFFGLGFGHDLHIHFPLRKFAALDGFV